MEYLLATAAVLAVLLALWNTWCTWHVMDQLERMLEDAIQGRFSEEYFNESRLSKVGAMLANHLSGCAISARNVADEKARLESLVADISHQTKTPLANILLYTQLLEELELAGEGRRYVSALEDQTQKLNYLIESLVKTSRLETGILALRPELGDLMPMLEAAVGQFLPRATEKNINLALAPTGATAVFDGKWTEEALCNLLDNAIKYTPEGGSVSVQATAYEMFCRIDVSDTGLGIAEEEQPKIFHRFYRSAAARKMEGVGLGLYLVQQIAEGQGGFIKVSSSPGKGAVFSLSLPRA